MELSEVFRKLEGGLHKKTDNKEVERVQSPESMAMWEEHSERMLVRFYTDPRLLISIVSVGRSMANTRRAGKQLMSFEADWGIKSNIVPHLQAHLEGELAKSLGVMALVREQALSLVPTDRRPTVEGKALLAAQEILTKKLGEKGLSEEYRAGASEMLKRIQAHLESDIALTGEKST
ncbi:hypothetical protein HY385_01885 [Candidatus Daviesbacteria bacterium]|nr:hypothetical protein [Candidatus Daviesbacteria bacterium]